MEAEFRNKLNELQGQKEIFESLFSSDQLDSTLFDELFTQYIFVIEWFNANSERMFSAPINDDVLMSVLNETQIGNKLIKEYNDKYKKGKVNLKQFVRTVFKTFGESEGNTPAPPTQNLPPSNPQSIAASRNTPSQVQNSQNRLGGRPPTSPAPRGQQTPAPLYNDESDMEEIQRQIAEMERAGGNTSPQRSMQPSVANTVPQRSMQPPVSASNHPSQPVQLPSPQQPVRTSLGDVPQPRMEASHIVPAGGGSPVHQLDNSEVERRRNFETAMKEQQNQFQRARDREQAEKNELEKSQRKVAEELARKEREENEKRRLAEEERLNREREQARLALEASQRRKAEEQKQVQLNFEAERRAAEEKRLLDLQKATQFQQTGSSVNQVKTPSMGVSQQQVFDQRSQFQNTTPPPPKNLTEADYINSITGVLTKPNFTATPPPLPPTKQQPLLPTSPKLPPQPPAKSQSDLIYEAERAIADRMTEIHQKKMGVQETAYNLELMETQQKDVLRRVKEASVKGEILKRRNEMAINELKLELEVKREELNDARREHEELNREYNSEVNERTAYESREIEAMKKKKIELAEEAKRMDEENKKLLQEIEKLKTYIRLDTKDAGASISAMSAKPSDTMFDLNSVNLLQLREEMEKKQRNDLQPYNYSSENSGYFNNRAKKNDRSRQDIVLDNNTSYQKMNDTQSFLNLLEGAPTSKVTGLNGAQFQSRFLR